MKPFEALRKAWRTAATLVGLAFAAAPGRAAVAVVTELLGAALSLLATYQIQDVVQAAAKTPGDVEILGLIAGHPRWGLRPAVRSAVLRNPDLSAPLALSLVTRATLEDLRGLRDSPRSTPLLRACAERVLAERVFED